MPKYTVTDSHIRHNDKLYAPGDEIELSEEEVKGLHVEPKKKASPSAGSVGERRAAEILGAMKLVKEEGTKLTQDGKPDVKAVEAVLGYNIKASERDELMPELEKKDDPEE